MTFSHLVEVSNPKNTKTQYSWLARKNATQKHTHLFLFFSAPIFARSTHFMRKNIRIVKVAHHILCSHLHHFLCTFQNLVVSDKTSKPLFLVSLYNVVSQSSFAIFDDFWSKWNNNRSIPQKICYLDSNWLEVGASLI